MPTTCYASGGPLEAHGPLYHRPTYQQQMLATGEAGKQNMTAIATAIGTAIYYYITKYITIHMARSRRRPAAAGPPWQHAMGGLLVYIYIY